MFSRDPIQLGQKTADIAFRTALALVSVEDRVKLGLVSGACRNHHLKRIPSLFRGLVPSIGAAPVFLLDRPAVPAVSPFIQTTPLPAYFVGARPKGRPNV